MVAEFTHHPALRSSATISSAISPMAMRSERASSRVTALRAHTSFGG